MPLNEDRLREVLPHLRPRSAEPTLFSQTVFCLLCLGLTVIVGLYFLRVYRLRRQRDREFFHAGALAGLTQGQTALLHRIARRQRMQTPVRLLSSAHVFDRQVGRHASRLAHRDLEHPQFEEIAQIRQALGFDAVPADQALTSTRQIARGQTVMVWETPDDEAVADAYIPWLVLERDEGTLVLAPLLRDGSAHDASGHRLQVGEEVSVRFWREGDTEYRFTTTVIGPVGQAGAVRVEHTASLERTQQRDFYRIDVDFPVCVYVLSADIEAQDRDGAHQEAAIRMLDGPPTADDVRVESTVPTAQALELAARVTGRVVNLSAGGFAMRVAADAIPAREGRIWLVDPAFEGDFPLAGLSCHPVGDDEEPGGRLVKLRFDDLSPTVEKEIVRGVYHHQLATAGGRMVPPAQLPLKQRPNDGATDVVPPA